MGVSQSVNQSVLGRHGVCAVAIHVYSLALTPLPRQTSAMCRLALRILDEWAALMNARVWSVEKSRLSTRPRDFREGRENPRSVAEDEVGWLRCIRHHCVPGDGGLCMESANNPSMWNDHDYSEPTVTDVWSRKNATSGCQTMRGIELVSADRKARG